MDTYENHQAFNRHLSLGGFRVNESGTKPSNYITRVKLRRAVKETSDMNIEEIFDNEMTEAQIELHREKLLKKIEKMYYWQLITALNILLKDGNYDTVLYICKCKRSDKEPQ